MGGFYRERWELYFAMVEQAMEHHTVLNCTEFVDRSLALTHEWMSSQEVHPNTTHGDALVLARAVYSKYSHLIRDAEGIV